jgi:hypothetical protein
MANYKNKINQYLLVYSIFVTIFAINLIGWSSEEEIETKEKLSKWAEILDQEVKPSGVYIKRDSEFLPDLDGWGTSLKVKYRNEGIAQILIVYSAGKDKKWETDDDLRVRKMQINAAGIGEGIKEHASEVAGEATKGVVSSVKEEASEIKNSIKSKLGEEKENKIGIIEKLKQKISGEDQNP